MYTLCITKQSLLMANVLYGGLPEVFHCEPTTKTKHMHHWEVENSWQVGSSALEAEVWDGLEPDTFCVMWTSKDGGERRYKGTPVVFRLSPNPPNKKAKPRFKYNNWDF